MDPYEILGVARGASLDEIRSAYRALAKKYHPDISADLLAAQKTSAINAAYEMLTNNYSSYARADYTNAQNSYEDALVAAYKHEYVARKFREAKQQAELNRRAACRSVIQGRLLFLA
jgi:curved DNA-binding protein CbpA